MVVGDMIGAYRVLAKLGEGGMGEVYRARDTRLKRDVALKVLPDHLAADPERRARFQREAQVLAGLTHQNIAALYGLEDIPSLEGRAASAVALVMELVEGETLARRIATGAVPPDEALALAQQIADALDYAHGHGVLHRDLKPANVKVTADGQVKLLDFGLAKAIESEVGKRESDVGDALANSPTITSPAATRAGTLLGTAAYMAPEQVRGRIVDRRADIWAFGCVLYEMLTGTRAFGPSTGSGSSRAQSRDEGDTVSDTLAAVLKSEPDWSRLPVGTPAPMRRLVQHCLQRDARVRLRDIGDARLLLQPASLQAVTPTPHGRRWLDVLLGAASAAALLAAVWFLAPSPSPPSAAGVVRRVTVPLPSPLPGSTSGGGPYITMSMDGSAIGFTGLSGGQRHLFVHRLADASTTVLRGTAGAGTPVLSADGRWVAFVRGNTAWRVAVDGGDPEELCVLRGAPRGGTWGADGRLLFATTAGLNEVTANGGDCEVSLPIDPAREARFLWPQVLPLKRGVLLTVSSVSDDADSASIVAIPAGTTERRVVVRGARGGRMTASGHLVFVRGSTIFAAPFDLDRLAITADPVAVVEGVASGVASGPLLGVSAGGDLVYASGGSENSQLVWISRNGTREDTGAPRRSYQPDPRVSPDGRRVAVAIGTADHYQWLYELDTGTLTPLVAETDAHGLVWSPDGRKVAYSDAGLRLSIKDLESIGEPEAVLNADLFPWAWSGDTLLFSRSAPDGGFNLVALDLSSRSERVLGRSRQLGFGARLSPDGHWLAYASDESGRLDVYVTDFPAARVKRPVSVDGGAAPNWASDGKELFFVSGTSMMSAAVVGSGDRIEFARPVRLFDGVDATGPATSYSVAPDGRFLFVQPAAPADGVAQRSHLTLVLNWGEELKQRVPVK